MKERIVEILLDYTEMDKTNVTEMTTLIADMGLNSLDIMNVIVAFEDEFDIEIPDRIISSFTTIGDIVNYLEKQDTSRNKS